MFVGCIPVCTHISLIILKPVRSMGVGFICSLKVFVLFRPVLFRPHVGVGCIPVCTHISLIILKPS